MKTDNYSKLLDKKKKLQEEISELEDIITFKKFSTSAKTLTDDLRSTPTKEFLIETGLNLALGGVYSKLLKNERIRKLVSYTTPFLIQKVSPFINNRFFNKKDNVIDIEEQNVDGNK